MSAWDCIRYLVHVGAERFQAYNADRIRECVQGASTEGAFSLKCAEDAQLRVVRTGVCFCASRIIPRSKEHRLTVRLCCLFPYFVP